MSTEVLERRFARIGARLKVEQRPWIGELRIDVRHDRWGEYFELRFQGGEREVDVEVVDARRDERHLLLLVRDGEEKSKFLCGHDERHLVRRRDPGGHPWGQRRDRRDAGPAAGSRQSGGRTEAAGRPVQPTERRLPPSSRVCSSSRSPGF